MTLILSAREARKAALQWSGPAQLECEKANRTADCEIVLKDPKQCSHGYRRTILLQAGLDILIDNYLLEDDLVVETEGSNGEALLELSFSIWGHNESQTPPAKPVA